ncbi:MAG: glycosyltransferase family 2 protein, partial [Bacteroidales bacterium]|nr:glycosyltransferase family 2 protein [Bacteroidales bacterium]
KVMDAHKYSYEVLFIDDGSRDSSWKVIENLSQKNFRMKGIKFQRNYGKSAALNTGFIKAQGDVIITMDADLQDSPDEIPELYQMIINDGYDLVSGWKKKRHDPLTKTIPTKLYNAVTRKMTGTKLHDMNCGLKSYSKEVIKSIEVYGEMHRYIPVIAKWAGFTNIGEKVVKHYPRIYGETKFGIERYINGFLDLLSIIFTGRFGKRPMHFFGLWGTLMFFMGFVIALYLVYAKFFMAAYRMTDRPLFYFGLISMVIGVQLFLAGFIGELISRTSSDKNEYLIAKEIGLENKKEITS